MGLTGTTTPSQSVPRSNDSKGVTPHNITQVNQLGLITSMLTSKIHKLIKVFIFFRRLS